MAIYSTQRLYKIAREKYAACESLIIEMSDLIKRVRPEFSTDVALAQFDLILQTCLLNSAVNDGNFLQLEKDFIVDIVKHTDIMPLINEELKSKGVGKIYWQTLYTFSQDTIKRVATLAASIVKPYADEFVENFAIVDKVVQNQDYRDLLYKNAGGVLISLVGIDGDDVRGKKATEETSAGVKMYDLLVNRRWREIVREK